MRLAFVLCCFVAVPVALAQEGTPHFWPGEHPAAGGGPAELAGFRFGDSPARARRACVRAAGRWSEEGSLARCTHLARSTGFPGKAALRFCDGALCEVALSHTSADAVAIADAYAQLRGAMDAAFGAPTAGRIRADDRCTAQLAGGLSAACFAQGDATARYFWTAGDFELELEVHPRRGAPALDVRFRAPARILELSRTSD